MAISANPEEGHDARAVSAQLGREPAAAAHELVREQLAAGVPAELASDLEQEAAELTHLSETTRLGQHSYSSKYLSSSSTMKSRQRGRTSYNYNEPPPQPTPGEAS